jgi:hypothetical protein
MSLTVDDILDAKPSLRARALEALKGREADQRAEEDQEVHQLMDETRDFLKRILFCDPVDVDAISFAAGDYSSERKKISFTFDGIDFQARYELEQVYEVHDHFDGKKEKIYDRALVIEAKLPKHPSHARIECLADLGALVK